MVFASHLPRPLGPTDFSPLDPLPPYQDKGVCQTLQAQFTYDKCKMTNIEFLRRKAQNMLLML